VSASVTCESPFIEVDPSSLKECSTEDAKGHCYDKNKVPVSADQLKACDGDEVCVPDKLLRANGQKAKSCTFFLGAKPGACVSMLLRDVATNKGILTQDKCDDDERCAPCIRPDTQENSHICDEPSGVHEADCTGGPTAKRPKSCCHAMGACISEEGVPPDQRGYLDREVCPDGQLCAPASQVDNQPVKCSVLGLAGVCVDVCFASVLSTTAQVTRAGCGPTELCVPCLVARGQGLLGCD
jgi:hypothetical protein